MASSCTQRPNRLRFVEAGHVTVNKSRLHQNSSSSIPKCKDLSIPKRQRSWRNYAVPVYDNEDQHVERRRSKRFSSSSSSSTTASLSTSPSLISLHADSQSSTELSTCPHDDEVLKDKSRNDSLYTDIEKEQDSHDIRHVVYCNGYGYYVFHQDDDEDEESGAVRNSIPLDDDENNNNRCWPLCQQRRWSRNRFHCARKTASCCNQQQRDYTPRFLCRSTIRHRLSQPGTTFAAPPPVRLLVVFAIVLSLIMALLTAETILRRTTAILSDTTNDGIFHRVALA